MTWRAGQSFRREAVVHLTQGMRGYQVIVDIKAKTVLSWTEVPGRQYMTSREEGDQANALAMKDPRVRSALTKRGITDFTHVEHGSDPFPAGLNDCSSALQWVTDNKKRLGASNVVVSGESGGANQISASRPRCCWGYGSWDGCGSRARVSACNISHFRSVSQHSAAFLPLAPQRPQCTRSDS